MVRPGSGHIDAFKTSTVTAPDPAAAAKALSDAGGARRCRARSGTRRRTTATSQRTSNTESKSRWRQTGLSSDAQSTEGTRTPRCLHDNYPTTSSVGSRLPRRRQLRFELLLLELVPERPLPTTKRSKQASGAGKGHDRPGQTRASTSRDPADRGRSRFRSSLSGRASRSRSCEMGSTECKQTLDPTYIFRYWLISKSS